MNNIITNGATINAFAKANNTNIRNIVDISIQNTILYGFDILLHLVYITRYLHLFNLLHMNRKTITPIIMTNCIESIIDFMGVGIEESNAELFFIRISVHIIYPGNPSIETIIKFHISNINTFFFNISSLILSPLAYPTMHYGNMGMTLHLSVLDTIYDRIVNRLV